MKHLGLLSFGITTAVLAPTIVHTLDAGPNQVAKLEAPGTKTISIHGASIGVSVDRAFVDPGAKVQLTLTGSSATAQRVAVEVLVYESTGTNGGRVETAPTRLTRETLAFDLEPGAPATKQLAIALPGNRGLEMGGIDPFGHYTIFVMPPADADKLDRMRRRAERVAEPMTDEHGWLGTFQHAFYNAGEHPDPGDDAASDPPFGNPEQIARLDVNTRPLASPVTVQVADTALVGYDLPVTVKVKNPTGHAIPDVKVDLSAKPSQLAGEYLGIDDSHVTIDHDSQDIAIAAHATATVTFHVRVDTTGTLGLFATARCQLHCDEHSATVVDDAALDAVDIVAGEAPTVVTR